jgi:hypothetical protein
LRGVDVTVLDDDHGLLKMLAMTVMECPNETTSHEDGVTTESC